MPIRTQKPHIAKKTEWRLAFQNQKHKKTEWRLGRNNLKNQKLN